MTTVENLVKFLEKCDHEYYVEGKPSITNDKYDALVYSLSMLNPAHPYLSKVGHKIRKTGKKVGRVIPMGTLSKYKKEDDVKGWMDKFQEGTEFMFAPKYDGFACELDYVDGRLLLASTRGDGTVGEDITSSAMKVVPQTVPKDLRKVRGEFIIPRENYETVKSKGYTAMRNAVPGIVRSDSELMNLVDFVAYEFFDDRDDREVQRSLYSNIFDVEAYETAKDIKEIREYRDRWSSAIRDQFKYEIDGVAIKTNEILDDDLTRPLYQIAWKFESNREVTILRGVKPNIGISGRFTPVGLFDAVEFQGAKLTSASLGNYDRLSKMQKDKGVPLKIGSHVEVSRRGDIIPYIEDVVLTPEGSQDLEVLAKCPHCDEVLEYRGSEPYCINTSCPKLLQLRVQQYVAGTKVKGIGAGLVSRLTASLITELADIYRLDAEEIKEFPGLGKSAVDKWKELQGKELGRLQFATSLPFVDIGPAVWKQLLETHDFQTILDMTEEDLQSMNLKRFGPAKQTSFIKQKNILKSQIEDLLNYVHVK